MPESLTELLFGPGPIEWTQDLLGPGRALLFRPLDVLGTVWGIPFAIGVALWLWGRRDAYALAAIMVAEAGIYLVLRNAFSISRPDAPGIVVYEPIDLPSFPSGHVFTVTTLWGLLWARGRIPFWLLALIVLSVGWGRLYLGVHYLGDVLGGLAAGAALVWAAARLWPRVRSWLSRRPPAFFTVAALVVAVGALLATLTLFGTNYHRWNSAGVVAGASLGLLLEHRWAQGRSEAARDGRWIRLLLGAAGVGILFLVDVLTGEAAYRIGAGAIFAATLWATLGVPVLTAGYGRR